MELARGDNRERMLLLGLASNPNHELHDIRRRGKIVFQKTLGRCLNGTNRGKAFGHHFLNRQNYLQNVRNNRHKPILNPRNESLVLFQHSVLKTRLCVI